MKIPLYLRIVLPLTLVACGVVAWSDATPEDDGAIVRIKPMKARAARIDDTRQTLPELTAAPVNRNLFPDQGRRANSPDLSVIKSDLDRPKQAEKPPEPLRAPPFPLQVTGIWIDGAERKIILTKGDQTTILCQGCGEETRPKVGDILEKNYRLEKIENERITFTYLPLKLKQIVNIDRAMSGTGN